MAKQVRNIWHPNDITSKMADKKGWKKAKEEGSLVILEDDGKSAIEAHGLMNGYLKKLREHNETFAHGEL